MSGSNPGWALGYKPTPSEWNAEFALKADFATTRIRTLDLQYNVMNIDWAGGAPNLGVSQPASTRFGTLAALQAAVGGTTLSGVTLALTQELDWIATQMAVNAAPAGASNGGTVYFPAGLGYMFSNSNSVADGSGQVVFPVTTTFTYHDGVSADAGFSGAILNWPVDLGAGKAGFLCAGRASGQSGGFFRGLVFIGPGVGSTMGATSSSMAAIMSNDRRNIYNCAINGFKLRHRHRGRTMYLSGYPHYELLPFNVLQRPELS